MPPNQLDQILLAIFFTQVKTSRGSLYPDALIVASAKEQLAKFKELFPETILVDRTSGVTAESLGISSKKEMKREPKS